MAGDVVSAGTFVAAVLEQTGYLTQGEFLVAFKSFFRDAGALVYFFGAVGGLVSLVLFGSFRAARYLIFGPAIYWALVGPTIEINGVVAKLGGGQPSGFIGDHGEAKAEEDRNAVLEKSGRDSARPIKVAEGFWLFARPINDFVNKFVDVMLNDENGENLMVEHKVRGLELVARSLPTSPEMINILEDELLKQCPRMYQSALGIAQNYVKARAVEGISKNSAPTANAYKSISDAKWKEYLQAGEDDYLTLDTEKARELYNLIDANKDNPKSKARLAYDGDAPSQKISCTLAWDIFLEMLWHEAAKHMPNILQLTAGAWEGKEAKEKACQYLTSKMYDDAPVEKGKGALCDIQPAVALALLSNHLAYMDTFQRVIKRHQNSQDPLNPKAHSSVLASTTLMGTKSGSVAAALFPLAYNALQVPVGLIANAKIIPIDGDVKGEKRAIVDYAPAVVMNLIQGVTHTEQVGLPIYIMTQARKELYAGAMQMPYYQGICLYLIAVAYPFMALLVLLPGKAQVFINIPLAWLWIKSWDIGFAAVIILERVMFNLLPNFSVAEQLRTKEAWDWKKLPIVLSEGFNFNHVQNVAQYYTMLAMATAGIPVLTGVIILKAKKAILGNFVGAISSQAKDAGMREAGSYSIASSNERAELRSRIEGFARQQVILGPGGVAGGLRGPLGSWLGSAKVLVNLPAGMLAKGVLKDGKFSLKGGGVLAGLGKDYLGKYMNAYQGTVAMQTGFEANHRAAFDPMFGRWGLMQMNADAYAAALDGAGTRLSGGFETNAQKANNLDAHMKMIQATVSNVLDLEMDHARNVGSAVASGISLKRWQEAALGGYYLKDYIDISGGDAEEKVGGLLGGNLPFSETLSEYSDKISKGLAASPTENNMNLWKMAFEISTFNNDDGYEKGLSYQKLFGFTAETILSASPEEREELKSRPGVMGEFYRFMYSDEVLGELEKIPGGASSQHLYGFGGTRSIHEVIQDGGSEKLGALVGGVDPDRAGQLGEFGKAEDWIHSSERLNSVLSVFGIELDQNQFFMNQKIFSDNVIRDNSPIDYTKKFYEIAEYLEKVDGFKDKDYDAGVPNFGEGSLGQLTGEAKKIIEIAREADAQFQGGPNGFRLPANINAIAESNPLLAAQMVESFFENLSQGQKAQNAHQEFWNSNEANPNNVFSTPSQATRK